MLTTSPRTSIVSADDEIIQAIADAVRWLATLSQSELTGDDSVGWWLLSLCGDAPSAEMLEVLAGQLTATLRNVALGRSPFYTFTALARTLARMGRTDHVSEARKVLETAGKSESIKRRTSAVTIGDPILRDQIWCAQALFELGADRRVLRELLTDLYSVVWRAMPIQTCMILRPLQTILPPKQSQQFAKPLLPKLRDVAKGPLAEKILDWELAYVLDAFTLLGAKKEASDLAHRLVEAQRAGRWDYDSDEEVESTSLVGLALAGHWLEINAERLLKAHRALAGEWFGFVLHRLVRDQSVVAAAWARVRSNKDRRTRGKALENFVSQYVLDDSKLRIVKRNVRTKTAEIDMIIEAKDGAELRTVLPSPSLLVECKHQDMPTPAKDIRDFAGKLISKRKMNCHVGILISLSGFTTDARTEAFRFNSQGHSEVIGLIGPKELGDGITRGLPLSALIRNAVIKATD